MFTDAKTLEVFVQLLDSVLVQKSKKDWYY